MVNLQVVADLEKGESLNFFTFFNLFSFVARLEQVKENGNTNTNKKKRHTTNLQKNAYENQIENAVKRRIRRREMNKKKTFQLWE